MSESLSSALKKPATLDAQVESITQASYIIAVSRIKQIVANKDGYGPDQIRLILEQAQAIEVRATNQRPAVRQALRNALKKLPAPKLPLPPSKAAKEITTEVVTPREAVLSDASKALEKLRKIVVKHEESFAAITLGPRLQIGLQCLKAHHVFSLPDPGKRGQGRKKNQLTRELISTNGLKGWLATECQWLKEPTAYKYMNAVRGLGLDHGATEKQVASALKIQLRKGPVTIKSLCDAAIEAISPPEEKQPQHEQQEFDLLKQTLTSFREETETLLNSKDKLDAYPDFKRAAVARLYGALHDLTGTHWKPSDEPDALALVDPDSITL